MDWLVFCYSLSSKLNSSPRVALWRRLRRLGALSLARGVYVLPAREECKEALQWLAQEVRQVQGEALVMRVEQFEGMADQQLIDLFRRQREEEYAEIDSQAAELKKAIGAGKNLQDHPEVQDMLAKLHRRHADIARVDYFDCPEGIRSAARLARIEQTLFAKPTSATKIAPADRDEYRDKRWVTRPRPHVDRLACAWLIRRFIDPTAIIRYATRPEPEEIPFDMESGQFSHQGNLCTFETMRLAFQLDDPDLQTIAQIVHEIDLRDGRYPLPEIAGLDAVLKGWLLAGLSDAELESHGVALFEGLHAMLASHSSTKALM